MTTLTSTTTTTTHLRLVLALDAAASGAVGVGLLGLSPVLDDLFGLPAVVAVPTGVFLLGYAAAVGRLARRPNPGGVRATIVGNLLWVAASVAYAALAWSSLTALGATFVIAQAAVVGLFADLQYAGLRRARAVR